jgi:exopolysaccharide production protein ExoZ
MAALGLLYHSAAIGAISIAVLATLMLIERSGKLAKLKVIKFIGDASFSIYLFQQFAFDFVDFLTRSIDTTTGTHLLDHIPERLVSVGVALGVGSILFITVERPLTELVRKVLMHGRSTQSLKAPLGVRSAHHVGS